MSRAAALLLLCLLPFGISASDGVETSGDVLRAAIPLAALAVAWQRDDRQGLESFLWTYGATAALTLGTRALVDDERPDGSGDDAFPSGHAATAFAGAAVLQRRYGWRTAWPAWVLAGYTGWTRVDVDAHDWTDVAGGALLGIASAWLVVEPLDGVQAGVAPVAGGPGLVLSARW